MGIYFHYPIYQVSAVKCKYLTDKFSSCNPSMPNINTTSICMWMLFITCSLFLQGKSSIYATAMQDYTSKCNSCTLYQLILECCCSFTPMKAFEESWGYQKFVLQKKHVLAWLLLYCCSVGSAGVITKGSKGYPLSPSRYRWPNCLLMNLRLD